MNSFMQHLQIILGGPIYSNTIEMEYLRCPLGGTAVLVLESKQFSFPTLTIFCSQNTCDVWQINLTEDIIKLHVI